MNQNPTTFHDLLNQKQWDSYSSFISEAPLYYQQELGCDIARERLIREALRKEILEDKYTVRRYDDLLPEAEKLLLNGQVTACLLYTSPSPRDRTRSRMPSSA